MVKKIPGQLKTCDDARPIKGQHTKPCSDCPFARNSLAGWLGNSTAGEWISAVHGDARIDCHVYSNQQCAGAAIYRANVCKVPRDRNALTFHPDGKLVFNSPVEFAGHHATKIFKQS